jgi:hypothetical protein
MTGGLAGDAVDLLALLDPKKPDPPPLDLEELPPPIKSFSLG